MPSSDKSHPSRRTLSYFWKMSVRCVWVRKSFRLYRIVENVRKISVDRYIKRTKYYKRSMTWHSKRQSQIQKSAQCNNNSQCSVFDVAMYSGRTSLAAAIFDARDYIKLQKYKCYMIHNCAVADAECQMLVNILCVYFDAHCCKYTRC